MPASVLICEACGARRQFVLNEAELARLQGGGMLQRHCPACRASANWTFAFEERRAGPERRQGERRQHPQ